MKSAETKHGLQVTTPTDREIVMTRALHAPRDLVFRAFTEPKLISRWLLGPGGWSMPICEVDLRVGGHYRLSMEDPDTGAVHTVRGEYREVQRPRRLVYSWCWEEGGGGNGHESAVTVEFHGEGERTRVVLLHTGLASPESRDQHGAGWNGCLDNLQTRIFVGARESR